MSDPNLLNTLTENWQGYSVIFAVLFASIAGSSHCITMCGPLAILLKKNKGNIHLYNIGRLITYVLLGFTAGLLGDSFLNSHYKTLSLIASVLLSTVLIYLGISLFRNKGATIRLPGIYSLFFNGPLGWTLKLNRYLRSLLIGIINGFLPCGWLYIFLIAALSLKSSYQGAVLLFFFWLGTVPSLTFLSYFSARVFKILPINTVRVAGVILLFVGLFNLIINFIPDEGVSLHHHHSHVISESENNIFLEGKN